MRAAPLEEGAEGGGEGGSRAGAGTRDIGRDGVLGAAVGVGHHEHPVADAGQGHRAVEVHLDGVGRGVGRQVTNGL